jgi:phosphoadenosine phosphosulfate reductase
MNIEKEKQAITYLRSLGGDKDNPYYLAYSGGKDSDTILTLAQLAGVSFEAVHHLTTVDAPETVYHVRKKGVKIERPERTMWQLIVDKGIPPTRIMRYCCIELKERGGQGYKVVTGVRKAESTKRAENGGLIKIIGKPATVRKKAEEIGAEYETSKQGGLILNSDNTETRELVEHCYQQAKVMINPIVEWTDADVWDFLRHYNVETNPLYECGFKRIGCIGCPMGTKNQKLLQFSMFPKYKSNYIIAFDKMLKSRKERGMKPLKIDMKSGEEVFAWWIGEDINQLSFDDLQNGVIE